MKKMEQIQQAGWPFLVATEAEMVLGYAYAAAFRDRPAYAHTCEDSIYIDESLRGQGIGSRLLSALLTAAAQAGFQEMIAVIGGGELASVGLHERLGFRHVGRLERVGFKLGQFLDSVYMQKSL